MNEELKERTRAYMSGEGGFPYELVRDLLAALDEAEAKGPSREEISDALGAVGRDAREGMSIGAARDAAMRRLFPEQEGEG